MRLIYLLLAVACLSPALAGEAEVPKEPKLTPATQRAVTTFEKDVAKARADFDKDVQKAKDKMAKSLETEMKSVMRKGDLDGATVIKALQEKLAARTGLEKTDILGKVIPEDKAGGAKPNHPGNPSGITIISAKYGVGDSWVDVTDYIRKTLKPKVMQYDYKDMHNTVGNPSPGNQKYVEVVYKIGNGEEKTKRMKQGVFLFD
jgi:hypothetical protein